MPLKYAHTQKAGVPFYAILVLGIFVCVMMLFAVGVPPVPVCILMPLVLLWAILLMSSLTVTMDDQFLRVRFGPGVFFKKIPLSEIAATGPKYTTYIWGWGIRWYPVGWLYNVAGFQSVEVILKNGRKVRIGTDEPEKLAETIMNTIA